MNTNLYAETRFEVEPERYEFAEPPRYRFEIDRRAFIQVVGAGILITFLPGGTALAQRAAGGGRAASTLGARLHIDGEGRITVFTSKVEVGQGSRTQLAQAAAEELHVPYDHVRLVMADTDLVPNDGGTFGSQTTPRTVPAVRQAAASARELLVELACKRWDVSPTNAKVQDGVITIVPTGQRITYAELSRSIEDFAEVVESHEASGGTLTAARDWKVLGQSVTRAAARDIVTGVYRYPSDMVRPEMLYGAVLRPPTFNTTLVDVDLGPALAMDGVVAVRDGQFAGVAAKTSFLARKALEAVAKTAKWDAKPHPSSDELPEYLKQHARRNEGQGRGRVQGDVDAALSQADRVLRESYFVPYIQHAPMEPRAALAEWTDGKLTVWTGTQRPDGVQGELAQAFGIPRERVRVIVPDTGGGFGGKHTGDAAVEAARLAQAAKRPVAVHWTREEEFAWAYCRPAGVIDIAAALDSEGRITAWDFANYNSGASGIDMPYTAPNVRTRFLASNSPLRIGSYRALAATANNFAREAFIDQLARAAGQDPLTFRLAHLAEGRLRAVLLAATGRFGWLDRSSQRQERRGIGLACGTEKGSFVAACAEVEVDPDAGRFKVIRLCHAYDCGAIQNPRNLRSQVEGCIIMGLGGALSESIEFKDGRLLNGNFKDYHVPRFKDVPPMDIVLLDNRDVPSAGAGETPIIAVAPAIANALYDATGRAFNKLPLTL